MKFLISISLLTLLSVSACGTHASQSASVVKADPSDSADKDPAADSLAAFTAPLTIDAKEYTTFARAQIEAAFGPSRDGKLVYQDALVVNGDGRFNDFTRLYYIAKVNSSLLESKTNYAAYYIGTNGSAVLSLVDFDEAGKNINLLMPGWMVNYSESVAESDMPALIAKLQKKYPDVMIEQIAADLIPRMISVHAKQTYVNPDGSTFVGKATSDLNKDQLVALQEILKEFNADSRIEYRENDAEVRNPGVRAPIIDLGEGATTKDIDLNALRTVTIEEIKSGSPATTKPSLPCPFSKTEVCAAN